MGYEEAIKGEGQRTEFRKAEKRYKLYKALRGSVPKARLTDDLPPTDLTHVIDFSNLKNDNLPPNVSIAKLDYPCPWPVFTITQRPGFYFLRGALDIDEQFGLIKESLGSFPQPPSRTNHTEFYGPIHNLWSAHAGPNRQHLVQLSNGTWEFMEEAALPSKSKSIVASTLVRKLRWATLGLQFDWSKRNYDVSLPHVKIPHKLSQLAKDLARPAMQKGEFHAEAAIVNYFGSDDMLGGHLDDMEADWSKPIVSISLGCKAIFLLGGESREETPFAMFLRSGDVVLMAGPARQCFHAMVKAAASFVTTNLGDITSIPNWKGPQHSAKHVDVNKKLHQLGDGIPRIFTGENSEVPCFQSKFSDSSDASFVDYIKDSRININIRQVY